MSGKGDTQRKAQVPDEVVTQNWDRIFKESPKRPIQENNYGKTNEIHERDTKES